MSPEKMYNARGKPQGGSFGDGSDGKLTWHSLAGEAEARGSPDVTGQRG